MEKEKKPLKWEICRKDLPLSKGTYETNEDLFKKLKETEIKFMSEEEIDEFRNKRVPKPQSKEIEGEKIDIIGKILKSIKGGAKNGEDE